MCSAATPPSNQIKPSSRVRVRVVFDQFDIERFATDALDEVRRAEQRELDPGAAKAQGDAPPHTEVPGATEAKPEESRRQVLLCRQNRALDRACELKEYLATILEQATATETPARLCE